MKTSGIAPPSLVCECAASFTPVTWDRDRSSVRVKYQARTLRPTSDKSSKQNTNELTPTLSYTVSICDVEPIDITAEAKQTSTTGHGDRGDTFAYRTLF